MIKKTKLNSAFTLAEVLITLIIIGVVAALTIPTLIANITDRQYKTSATKFERDLAEALRVMNLQGTLNNNYTSTKDFVAELSKHIKIINICDENNLSECFENNFIWDDKNFTINDIKNKTSIKIFGTESIGIQFANSVNAILAYNPNCTQNPFDNDIIKLNKNAKEVHLSTDAISIIYDVNGNKKPNTIKRDIYNRNLGQCSKTGNFCIATPSVKPINCTDKKNDEYCIGAFGNSNLSTDYWAGARKKCDDLGLELADFNTFKSLYDAYLLAPSWFVLIDEYSNEKAASTHGNPANHLPKTTLKKEDFFHKEESRLGNALCK